MVLIVLINRIKNCGNDYSVLVTKCGCILCRNKYVSYTNIYITIERHNTTHKKLGKTCFFSSMSFVEQFSFPVWWELGTMKCIYNYKRFGQCQKLNSSVSCDYLNVMLIF